MNRPDHSADSLMAYQMRRDCGGRQHKVIEFDGFEGYEVRFTDSCSGCCESVDGQHLAGTPYDKKAGCYVGMGCDECGYSGKRVQVQWIPFDPDAYMKHRDDEWAKQEAAK